MAKERFFTGFEAGQAHDLNVIGTIFPSTIVCDGTARTGDFFYQIYHPTTTSAAQRCTKLLTNSYTCTGDGDKVIARMQIAVRAEQLYPTSSSTQLFGWSTGTTVSPAQDARVYLNTDGTVSVHTSASIGGGPAAVSTGFRLVFGRYYVIRLEFTYQRNNAGNDTTSATIWIYDGDSMDAPDGPTLLAQATSAGTIAIADFSMSGSPTLGSASSPTSARVLKYDDWWYSIADGVDANPLTNLDLAWPLGSRVAPVVVTQQISSSWAGDVNLVRDIPNSGVVGNEQTQTGAGAQTIFGHQTAVELGLIPPSTVDTEDPAAPPFTGAAGEDGWSAQGQLLFGPDFASGGHDGSLPVPASLTITPTAGAGFFTGGVWVRAATLRLTGQGSARSYRTSAWTAAQYISAAAYPSFALAISADLDPATPADALVGSDGFVRYGIAVLVTNAYNGGGLLDPSTGNTTNLDVSGGQGIVNAAPYGSLVALQAFDINTSVPYPFTNPGNRPVTRTFATLQSPQQSASWSAMFAPPQTPGGSVDLPVCAAIKVYANIKRTATPGTDSILLDGVPTSVPSATNYLTEDSLQVAYNWTEKTAAEFDAMTFGAQTDSAIATQLGNCLAEVLTAGPTVRKSLAATTYIQKCGIYTSNNGFQSISVGFRPAVVLVKRIGTVATPGALKCWWMGGTMSWPVGNPQLANTESIAILDITDDGFLVGPSNSVNGPAATYAYVAIADGSQDVNNGAYLIAGSYFSSGTSDPTSVPIAAPNAFVSSWTPDVLWINGVATVIKTPEIVDGSSLLLSNAAALVTNAITSIGNGTFTLGANGSVVGAGQYPFLALRSDVGGLLASAFETGSFVGTGGAQTIPTPFTPGFVVLHKPGGSYTGRFRSGLGNAGSDAVPWPGGAVTTIDITAIAAASFDVGTGASVLGAISYWLIWKGDATFGDNGGGGGDDDDGDPGDNGDPGDDDPPTTCSGGGLPIFPPTIGAGGCTVC